MFLSSSPVHRLAHRSLWTFAIASVASLVASLTSALTTAQPAQSAERIYVTYGLLERSVSFEGLKQYAETGELDDDLFVYTSYVSPEQREQLRDVLRSRADLDPVAISQFLYSPQGELLLKRLGKVIQPEARTDGLFAIRAALILAAADRKDGLSPLNIIQKFPTRGIRVDLQSTLRVAGDLEKILSETRKSVAAVVAQADRESQTPISNRVPLPDLSVRGRIPFERSSVTLTDPARSSKTGIQNDRTFPVDVYIPRTTRQAQLPVVVISHGLGSDRTTFRYFANHLASHGFAVFVPEHPGSSGRQIDALLRGLAQEVAEPAEFVDRPLDIRYLLDYFSKQGSYRNLNFNRVGVIGQSFGGYTALSLAGAPLNFESLAQECTEEKLLNTFNVSITLQCRATQLEPRNYELSDPRIAAAIAINPLSSGVHGKSGLEQIKIPTMMISSGADTVAPALPEQIIPFSHLKMRDRYLVMVDQGSHFSFLEDSPPGTPGVIPLPAGIIGPGPAQARRYLNALGLAFFRSHLTDQPTLKPFLSATYTKSISNSELPIVLTTQFDLNAPLAQPTGTGIAPLAAPSPQPTPKPTPSPNPVSR